MPCSSNVADGSSTSDGNLPLPLQRNIRKRKIDSDDKPSSTNDANDGPSTAAEKAPMQRSGNVKERTIMKKQNKNTKTLAEPAKRVYRWRKTEPPTIDASFKGDEFKDPPDEAENITPLTYFCVFFTDNILAHIVEQSNLDSVQKTGKNVNTNREEIKLFIGIQIRMSIVRMTVYRHYWAAGTRYAPIADAMTLTRYENLRRFLHFNDNSQRDNEQNKDDKLFKISPILNHLRERCQTIDKEQILSIDEQIVPAKTKRSGIRQYNPRKPVKWGFKMFIIWCIWGNV